MPDAPVLGRIRRQPGVAGQIGYSVFVQYPGEDPVLMEFVGSVYGNPGPVVMLTPGNDQAFVSRPERFGPFFGIEWVRRFFA